MKSFIVIGGGIVGLATAWKLTLQFPSTKVTILEKEPNIGAHQSTHNSGVLHCGLYYKPGSLKARLAVNGLSQMVEFCRTYNIPHEICGKLVVATDDEEENRLDNLLQRGSQNGLKGLKKIGRREMLSVEPNVGGRSALLVPQEGIIDYKSVCKQLAINIIDNGGHIIQGAKVTNLKRKGAEWIAKTQNEKTIQAEYLINCTGLYSDKVATLGGVNTSTQIVPFRGEYFKLAPHAEHLVKNLIYPVPNPAFPFLGVHFTRLIEGGIEAGPNAVLAFSREGYKRSQINIKELAETIVFPGLRRFIYNNPRVTLNEFHQSLSKKRFCKSLQNLLPEITENDLTTGGSGVRAQAMTAEGHLIQDFQIEHNQNALHVLNAPSPAATASLAIAQHICDMIPPTRISTRGIDTK